jgi:hypothetical protein
LLPENLKEHVSEYLRIARLYLFLQELVPQIIKAEYYSNGKIRIIIEYEKDGNIKKHIIETTREAIDKVIEAFYMAPSVFIELYGAIPEIIPFSIIVVFLWDYDIKPRLLVDLYGAGYIFNRIAIAKIVEEMKKPRIEEEGILNYLFNEILNHKYVFEWEKRKEVIKALDIDPNEIIFVDDNFVYIPRRFVSTRIKIALSREEIWRML